MRAMRARGLLKIEEPKVHLQYQKSSHNTINYHQKFVLWKNPTTVFQCYAKIFDNILQTSVL